MCVCRRLNAALGHQKCWRPDTQGHLPRVGLPGFQNCGPPQFKICTMLLPNGGFDSFIEARLKQGVSKP